MNGFPQSVTKATQCTPNDCNMRRLALNASKQSFPNNHHEPQRAGNRCKHRQHSAAHESGHRSLSASWNKDTVVCRHFQYCCDVAQQTRGAGTFFAGSSSCLYTQRSSSPTELSSQESVGCVRKSHVTRDTRPMSLWQRTRRLHRASSTQEAGRPIVRRQPHRLLLPRRC